MNKQKQLENLCLNLYAWEFRFIIHRVVVMSSFLIYRYIGKVLREMKGIIKDEETPSHA